MLITLPFFAGDRDQAIRLANWIKQLGGVGHHDCLLVVDKGTTAQGVLEPCQAAFRSVTVIPAEPAGKQGTWGLGTTDATAANEMWLTASSYIFHKFKCRWFWLEPDAVPIRSAWADELEAEDRSARKPFMGAYVNIPPHEPHMSGIAVYPPNVPDYSLDMAIPGRIAWDYAGRRDTVGKAKAHFTKLIQHEYRIHGESPTFPSAKSLSVIKPETAVFHRCKNDTLILRLSERLSDQKPAPAVQTREQTLEARVKELEGMLRSRTPAADPPPPPKGPSAKEELLPKCPTVRQAVAAIVKLDRKVRRRKANKRTPEQQAIIDARMAKARAARKKTAA